MTVKSVMNRPYGHIAQTDVEEKGFKIKKKDDIADRGRSQKKAREGGGRDGVKTGRVFLGCFLPCTNQLILEGNV
jgi:hypothetical protein